MKRLKTSNITSNSALPIKAGTLEFLQDAYKEGFEALIIGLIGNSTYSNRVFLLYGCELTGTSGSYNIAEGAVFYQGEIYLVDNTQSINALNSSVIYMAITQSQFTTQADPVTFTDGNAHNVHDIKKMSFSSSLVDNIDTYPNLITCLQSSVTSKGVVQLASNTETIAGSPIATKAITPDGLQYYTGRVKTKLIHITGWNMDTTDFQIVSHGIGWTGAINQATYKVLSIRAMVVSQVDDTPDRNLSDMGNDILNPSPQGWIGVINNTDFTIFRKQGGIFDDAVYYNGTFSSVWVLITYIP